MNIHSFSLDKKLAEMFAQTPMRKHIMSHNITSCMGISQCFPTKCSTSQNEKTIKGLFRCTRHYRKPISKTDE
jgi:hypothetical protein